MPYQTTSIIDIMREQLPALSDDKLIALLKDTESSYKITGGDEIIHLLQISMIKQHLKSRGLI